MVVTDLDGTLLRSDRSVHPADWETLRVLGRLGVVRVVATGRSLHSARLALPPGFPIDFLIFSTGSGIMSWSEGPLLHAHGLCAEEIERAVSCLSDKALPFMLHEPVPDNHRFLFRRGRGPWAKVPDFERRIVRYRDFAEELGCRATLPASASQLLVILEAGGEALREALADELAGLEVIRATSPLDGVSVWLEIFPAGVDKGAAARWLARHCRVNARATVAVGNDYNDEALLAWGRYAFVVANAPAALKARYESVASNDDGGFSAAVATWRSVLGV